MKRGLLSGMMIGFISGVLLGVVVWGSHNGAGGSGAGFPNALHSVELLLLFFTFSCVGDSRNGTFVRSYAGSLAAGAFSTAVGFLLWAGGSPSGGIFLIQASIWSLVAAGVVFLGSRVRSFGGQGGANQPFE